VYDWVAHLERSGAVHTVVHTRWTGKRHETDTYRFAQAVPLCDADGALEVNWCALTTTDAHGKILYRNAFTTTFALTADTVVEVVAAGRSRWKIENENNNVLKTKGYHFGNCSGPRPGLPQLRHRRLALEGHDQGLVGVNGLLV
jgi:hypothetical protein